LVDCLELLNNLDASVLLGHEEHWTVELAVAGPDHSQLQKLFHMSFDCFSLILLDLELFDVDWCLTFQLKVMHCCLALP
jgi:hypothetical protein